MLHQRMISSSAKRYEPALVGDNVTIPIERPDKMNSLGQQNVLGVIIGASDDVYTIGTKYGSLGSSYTGNQFDLCTSNRFLHPSDIPEVAVSQTTVMRNSSLGLEEGSFAGVLTAKQTDVPVESPIALVTPSVILEESASISNRFA